MFDSSWMTKIPDKEGSALIPDTQYRVRLCVSPALVSRDDTKWSQGPVLTHECEGYKLALLESRDFFTEDTVQEKASPRNGLISRAVVFVEAVPKHGGMEARSQ
ncbi:hypothetical protein IG631_05363 [Alternaria alternata]|nr:hypothetical protein IG631_05363 [Alternaria alternata]